jgi:proteasome lid subunit RPN8/RPN11
VTEAGITLPAAVAAAIEAHARSEAPNEACGLLAGSLATGQVMAFHPARNALASPYRFDIDAGDLVDILDGVESAGQELVAIFHSHPRSPAVPSPLDRREARYAVFQLVASLAAPEFEMRAWRLVDGEAVEVPLRVSLTGSFPS